jgi:hypothetical protein
MEAVCSSETSVYSETTRRYVSEGSNLCVCLCLIISIRSFCHLLYAGFVNVLMHFLLLFTVRFVDTAFTFYITEECVRKLE